MKEKIKKVLVTGGAGYVGSVLVPRLLQTGYDVKVLDLYLFGKTVFSTIRNHPRFEEIEGDIRDQDLLKRVLPGCDAVIHLACISNDPSFELNPDLGRSINFDAFEPLVRLSKENGVRRFIYASTSSVYGVSDAPSVTEDHPLNPLTDYSKYKGLCEPILLEQQSPDFTTIVIRPATVCGYSPRQRLDLVVNILTNHAVNQGKIKVLGGTQMRPNINILDMAALYEMFLELPQMHIAGKTYNVGCQNDTVAELAEMVKRVVQREMPGREKIDIEMAPTNDLRSYHICSKKIERELNYKTQHTIEKAIKSLIEAFKRGLLVDGLNNESYHNVKQMQALDLK